MSNRYSAFINVLWVKVAGIWHSPFFFVVTAAFAWQHSSAEVISPTASVFFCLLPFILWPGITLQEFLCSGPLCLSVSRMISQLKSMQCSLQLQAVWLALSITHAIIAAWVLCFEKKMKYRPCLGNQEIMSNPMEPLQLAKLASPVAHQWSGLALLSLQCAQLPFKLQKGR